MNPNNKPKYTEVLYGTEAMDAIGIGVDEVTRAVVSTLGPTGRNTLLEERWGSPTILHDGIRTAEAINPKDPFIRAGAKIMQEAGQKQRNAVGDGTSVVTLLTHAIFTETRKEIKKGTNPMRLRRELEAGRDKVINKLSTLATPIETLEQKQQIATISAEDEELGQLIADVVHKTGTNGVITVEESKLSDTVVEYQEGMQIDKGYVDPFMITDHERQTAVLEDAHLLVTDYPLVDLAIGGFLDKVVIPNTKKILFLAPEIGGDFLMATIGMKMKGGIAAVGVRAPGVGILQTNILQDICALTGATFISKEAGMKFDDLTFADLGHVERVIASKTATIIHGGAGHRDDVLQRIASIRGQLKDETISEFDKVQLQGRLAKLTGGVAVIKVAGETEIEMKERKERVIDAICATQAAVRSGIVPGGETIYLDCLGVLNEKILGEKILKEALTKPFKQLINNAGYYLYENSDEVSLWHQLKVWLFERKQIISLAEVGRGRGFDVMKREFTHLMDAGIIDPAEVSQSAIKTSVSVAVALSSMGSAICYEND